jgi:hypothetical protein
VTTQRTASTAAGPTTEPALRPISQRHPAIGTVRSARIFYDGRGIVVRAPDGSERNYLVGGRGIRRAVHLNIYDLEIAKQVCLKGVGHWGVLYFQDSAGRCVLRVPLRAWLPEAFVLDVRPISGAQLLALTGAQELLKVAGIPLEVATSLDDPLLAKSRGGVEPTAEFADPLPGWFSWARGVAMIALLIGLFVGAALWHSAPWLSVLGAAGALAFPIVEAALRMPAAIREKRQRPESIVQFSPCPPANAGASVRFIETAAIRLYGNDLVVVSSVGHERWLPRKGAHSIAKIVRVVGRGSSDPLGVELRDTEGNVRAALPWQWWFSGPHGESNWGDFTAALARPVIDREVKMVQGAAQWPLDQVAKADVKLMAPLEARIARETTSFYESVARDSTVMVVSAFSLAMLGGGFAMVREHAVTGIVTMALSGLAFLGLVGPVIARQLRSRLRLDRPAPGQEPQV